jgi:TonB-linked SusC/RagA family outer membrane protein
MRRFLSLFTVLMLCGVLAFAQSRVVSGRVTDKDGNPVPFASVTVNGARTGLSADANGSYTIRVKDGDVLSISGTGFRSTNVNVGTLTNINTTLEKADNSLKEVVVTGAFNTKRTARSVSSAVQNVNSEQLNTIRQTNVNNALAGKVAGIQVQSQSAGKLGAETNVRLRGENGLGIGGGALYVVDGTIIPSANDINTDDVEDVTVLQGPAAAALFGPDGANGAIVITTKKARRGSRNLGIEINSGVTFDKVYILPDYQNSYAGGDPAVSFGDEYTYTQQYHYRPGVDPAGWANLDGKYYPDYQEDASWGPRMIGQEYIPYYAWYPGTEYSFKTAKLTPQPTNARDFFNTAVTKNNNINLSKSGDNFSTRISYTNLDQQGLVPNSWLKKNTFNGNFSVDLSSKFTAAANITYISQRSNTENDDTYSNNSTGSFNQWFHRDIDMNILRELQNVKSPTGQLLTWNHSNPDNYNASNPAGFYRNYYWFSPFGWIDNIANNSNRDRLYGDASITYKPNNDFSLKFTYRKQQLTTNTESRQYKNLETSVAGNTLAGFNYWETVANRAATWQGYSFGYSTSNRQNYEVLATYRKTIKDFTVGANAGVNIFKATQRVFNWNSTGGLLVADEFLTSNSKTTPVETNTITNSASRALFARADVGFRNMAFIEGTYRRDYSSTEQLGFYIDTKSAGASFIFSDLINKRGTTFLSYGKLRGSIGQVVNTLAAYQNSVLFSSTTYATQYAGNRLVTVPDRLVDPLLQGANQTEKEVGIDLRFWKNRIGISATYWDRTNKDFPFDVTISGYSGFTTLGTNVGEVKKKGVDLTFFVNPIKSRNFDWTINATWGRLIDNTIVSIAPGVPRTPAISSGQAGTNAYLINEEGMQWGELVGKGILRNTSGQPILNTDGTYKVDPTLTHFGNSLPDYTGGIQNTFNLFKNFVVNVNIDYSHGGKFFSTSEWYGSYSGLWATTAGLNDKGNPVRDNPADGGGVHVFGVDATNKAVDYYVGARDYFHQFVDNSIVEPYIKDLTFVKMREVSIGYRLPVEKLSIGRFVKTATFSIVSRNPWLIYSAARGFDPSEISVNYGEDGQLPGTRSLGVNLKIGF